MKRQKENAKDEEDRFWATILSSAEAVFNNEDLLLEILLRVPAKALIRFKCVSKYLLSLTSDSQFRYKHTSRNREFISALYYHSGTFDHDKLKSVSLRGHRNPPNLSFLNSIEMSDRITVRHACNGLMLCYYGYPENYIVCNLTTQEFVILSQPSNENEDLMALCSLAYNPTISPYYKVIVIRYGYCGSYSIYIYSSENLSWKRIHASGPGGDVWDLSAFCNGAVHWMSTRDYYFRFEVDAEKLIGKELPEKPRILYGRQIKFFGECGGQLLLIQHSTKFVVGLNIHQMDMENCCWIMKQRISLRPIEDAFPGRISFNLLTIVRGSREGDIIPVLAIEGKVIAYNPRCQKYKVISYNHRDEFRRNVHLQKGGAYQHVESLSPV